MNGIWRIVSIFASRLRIMPALCLSAFRAADWAPGGSPAPAAERPAAVFYIHPTTYLQKDRWNAPLSGNRDADFRARLFLRVTGVPRRRCASAP